MDTQCKIHGKELLKVCAGESQSNLLVLRPERSVRVFGAHPLVEEFNKRYGLHLKVVSHKAADAALSGGETWRSLPAFPVDAAIAYERPATKMGKEIVFSSMFSKKVILATGKYEGERDLALVALGLRASDFKADGGSIVLEIPDKRLIAVRQFTGVQGWGMPHAGTGVPCGKERTGSDARYIWGTGYESAYVGLIVRGIRDLACHRQVVYAASTPEPTSYGVVAEVPERDLKKVNALLSSDPKPENILLAAWHRIIG